MQCFYDITERHLAYRFFRKQCVIAWPQSLALVATKNKFQVVWLKFCFSIVTSWVVILVEVIREYLRFASQRELTYNDATISMGLFVLESVLF